MVMADRPEVRTATAPVAAIDVIGLAQQLGNALVRVPFRSPLQGRSSRRRNLGQAVTREVLRTFMGYSSSLPIEEFRSIEVVIDSISKVVLAPVVALEKVDAISDEIAGVPGIWYRPKQGDPIGRILYLHGGGYVGTSPNMYAFFTARLAATTGCEVFVADYRLAPEFPFPAGRDDAIGIVEEWLAEGNECHTIFLAGDSGGGGLVASLMHDYQQRGLPRLGGLVLFSPEIDLQLDLPSVTDNADKDILPWNIPTSAYLHGEAAADAAVSALDMDVSGWPPVFLSWGSDEMLRDSIRLLTDHLGDAGVPTTGSEAEGMFHVFPILMPWAAESRSVYRTVAQFTRDVIDDAPGLPARATRA
jgi:acetyl esterase/lipase